MPGSRLTLEERRRIGEGLAQGLSFSRIAAELDRPASTVTREVARNGGPGGYRADLAHQASRRRARRRPKPAPFRAAGHAAASEPREHAVPGVEFTGQFTALLVDMGLPQVAAKVLACLYATDAGRLTSAELVRYLRVSPGAVSRAVGQLEGQALIRRERDGHRRPERYVVDSDLWFEAVVASARTTATVAEAARDGAQALGRVTPAGARLAGMSEFLGRVGRDLVNSAEHWRNVLTTLPAQGRREREGPAQTDAADPNTPRHPHRQRDQPWHQPRT